MNSNQMNLGEMGRALTQRMTSVVEGLRDKYSALYNTEDFISKINDLKRCDPDEIGSIQTELVRMFKKCGIEDVKYGQPVSYYGDVLKNSNIPTPREMTHNVYESFLQEFVDNPFPLPEEYIERIVDSKIAPEWKNDTLRLKILKKFLKDADGLTAAGYNRCFFARTYVSNKTGAANPSWDEVVDHLDDDVFLEMEKELALSKEAQEKYKEYTEKRERISNRKKELRATKEYKELSKSEKKHFLTKDKVIAELSEKVGSIKKYIEREENNRKEKIKKNGKFALLKIADDLAHGKFGNANVVREEIYLFAIVFELTYFTGDSEEIVSEDEKARDIENVMFGDYYANNIMRYISSGHEYIKSGGERQNPTGKGINYKNYMEVIFLYFLRRWDLSITDKLEKIYKMAGEVHAEYKEKKKMDELSSNKKAANMTQYYETEFKKNVLETYEQFKEFLLLNYDCSMPPETTPVFSTETEQQTAYDEYMRLIEDAEDYGVGDEDYEKWTLAFLTDEMDLDRIKKIHEDREKAGIDFENIDDKTKFDILLYEVNRDLSKKKSHNELDRKIISRTDILRLFYQIYINMNRYDDDEAWRSFPDVYDDFSETANQHLIAALLRPINGRDLYDLILIYSAYCNINEDKFD